MRLPKNASTVLEPISGIKRQRDSWGTIVPTWRFAFESYRHKPAYTGRGSMTNPQNRIKFLAAGALALSFAALVGAPAPAISAPNFDGLWSVVIVTEKGTCDRAYRYPVRIANGSLVNAGDTPIAISGKVGGNGAITVTVSHGSKSAIGSGRLGGAVGGGSWKGGDCSGVWEAERRSS
jgi:hypothetical protein